MRDYRHRDPRLQPIHLLRGITVELDLLGAEFAARSGLHPTDLRALIHLLDFDRAGEPATPGRLGERMGLNSPSVTAVIDRLEQQDLVTRDRDPDDRRRVLLTVTEHATTLGWSFFGPLIDRLLAATTTDDFTEDDMATVRRFLRTVADAVTAERQRHSSG